LEAIEMRFVYGQFENATHFRSKSPIADEH